MKSAILERLGESGILLPVLIAEGLAANDRIKVRLSVLQAAARHAADPAAPRLSLGAECRSVGLDPVALDDLVAGAAGDGAGQVTAPGLAALGTGIWEDAATMVRAVAAGAAVEGKAAASRLAAIRADAPLGQGESVPAALVQRLTGLGSGGDSLHRLVMDLHKALNQLSRDHAEAVVAGAHVFGLADGDREDVEAFMAGVEATRPLKFGHPGLGTTAARAGDRLTIQNDIGETDAHVVVISVEPHAVTITYSDVHRIRAKFFTGLLPDFAWSGLERHDAAGLGPDPEFHLVTGRAEAKGAKERHRLLREIGAVLVFQIDWNKARKVLRTWIPKKDAVAVLDWAARGRIGHRGFLVLGGAALVASAVQHAAGDRIGFGERLDSALGREAAIDFLKSVLAISTGALMAGESVRLVRDRIEAALVTHLERAEATLLAAVVRQAGLARDIGAAISAALTDLAAGIEPDRALLADRARRIEEKADRIAIDLRERIARLTTDPAIEPLALALEQAVDELEQAAFILSLLPAGIEPGLLSSLCELAGAAVAGAEAAASAAAAAAAVPDGHRIDSEDALAAAGRLVDVEHAADRLERQTVSTVLGSVTDLRSALAALELARALERATDRFAGFGHLLRRRVLADLAA